MSENITLEKLFEEVVSFRGELRNLIGASEARLSLKIEALNRTVQALEKENLELRSRLEVLERGSNKRNLILFGLSNNNGQISTQFVCQELKRLLQVDINESQISDLYTLGKGNNCPVKLELISYSTKREILSNTRKLKDTNIKISNDLTEYQREEQRNLRKYLVQVRARFTEKCVIRGNKIHIGDKRFDIEQLERMVSLENNEAEYKVNSAPSTPASTRVSEAVSNRIGDKLLYKEEENRFPQQKQDEKTIDGAGQSNKSLGAVKKTTGGAVDVVRERLRLRSQK